MKTNVNPIFEGPSDFHGMFEHAVNQSQQKSVSFAGQTKTADGGRWSAYRNNLIDVANAKANREPVKVHPNNPRYNPNWH